MRGEGLVGEPAPHREGQSDLASDWMGVVIAPDDDMFTVSPTWTRLDSGITGLRVASIQIRRGRQSEFEDTGTGTCSVTFHDQDGVLDPTNSGSSLYGKTLSRPFAIAIRDPVQDEWFPLFRGHVDDIQHDFDRSVLVRNTVITAVDCLDYFANFELVPGLAGFTVGTPNAAGYVYYPEAGFDERLSTTIGVLSDCQWPSGLTSLFTGNVICREARYSSGDKVLQVIQEACDAEFPTVANYYVDKQGRLQIHGRYARFDPDTVSATASNWDFTRWKAGDNAAATADPGLGGTAKMQEPYAFIDSRAMIRNAALAYPEGVDQSDLSAYIYEDATSRAEHGTRTWTAPNLQLASEETLGLTAKAYCKLIGEYIVENYKQSYPRISSLTLGSEHPTHGEYGAATWQMICGADISDYVAVTIDHPGAGGFSAAGYYIEGRTDDIRPGPGSLDNAFPIIKTSLDLSPADRWAHNPFGAVPS